MKWMALFFICIGTVNAFTLLGRNLKFDNPNVTVNISSNSCANAGISHDELFSLVEEAMENYWNAVPTSALELSRGGIIAVDVDGDLAQLQPNNTILVGCSAHTSFDAGSSYPEGLGGMGRSGQKVYGFVLVNNVYTGGWATGTHQRLLYVIAHELGHAVGLHHSHDPASIMSYNAGYDFPNYLSQDDMDGVTYLYPMEMSSSCGTVSVINDKNIFNMVISFVLGFILFKLPYYRGDKTAQA